MEDIIDKLSFEDISAFKTAIDLKLSRGECKGCELHEKLKGPTLREECIICWKEDCQETVE